MAVAKMKRFRILTLKDEAEPLADELQSLRCVDIERASAGDETGDVLAGYDTAKSEAAVRSRMQDTTAAIDFLALYRKKSRGLFSPPKEIVRRSASIPPQGEGASATVARVLALKEEKARLSAELSSLSNEAESLRPWVTLDAPIPRFRTAATLSAAGSVPAKALTPRLEAALGDKAAVVEVVGETPSFKFVLLTAYRSDFEDALAELSRVGFTPASAEATEADGFAAGKLASVEEKIGVANKRLGEIDGEAEKLSEESEKIELLYDLLSTEEEKLKAVSDFSVSDKCALISGWVPERAVPRVTDLLDRRGDAYEFSDPAEGDDVPVLLSNNRFTESFEPVIELYSLPKYGSFDPTSIMSIFYIVIFGLMLADVGYGVLISLACFFGIKLMKPKKSMRNMMMMFGKCGISCIAAGILFGGYFGDAPAVIMDRWFNKPVSELAVWFNPLTNFTTFLILSLAIGAVHLITGLAIKFWVTWKRGHRLDAIFDSGSWILLFLGAGVFLLNGIAGGIMVGVALLTLIATQGRHSKNPLMKVFGGFASLYDIVGYLSDLLSYSRILALGLASMVIASVFNILSTMPGFSFGGVIFFVIVFIVGHVLNLAINMLGTFVHTSRLQYIEFFGKFYEDGGRPFEPLEPKSKYVIFK